MQNSVILLHHLLFWLEKQGFSANLAKAFWLSCWTILCYWAFENASSLGGRRLGVSWNSSGWGAFVPKLVRKWVLYARNRSTWHSNHWVTCVEPCETRQSPADEWFMVVYWVILCSGTWKNFIFSLYDVAQCINCWISTTNDYNVSPSVMCQCRLTYLCKVNNPYCEFIFFLLLFFFELLVHYAM